MARRRGRKGDDADLVALQQALDAVLDDDWERAENGLSEIAREDSERVDAYLALAKIYRRRGEIGRSIRLHQNLLLRTDLAHAEREASLQGLAQDFQRGGFLQRAIAAYHEVLEQRPKEPRALRAMVRLAADARDFELAFAMQKRLGRVEPDTAREDEGRLLVERAQAALAAGRTDDARTALKKAVRRTPMNAMAWIRLGDVEAERGKNKAALAAWRKAVEVDRRAGARVYPKLESAYAAMGKTRDFEALLQGFLKERPGDTPARLALVQHLASGGQTEAALVQASEGLDRDSDSLPLEGARARVALSEHREGELVAALERLLGVLDRQGLLTHRERLD